MLFNLANAMLKQINRFISLRYISLGPPPKALNTFRALRMGSASEEKNDLFPHLAFRLNLSVYLSHTHISLYLP